MELSIILAKQIALMAIMIIMGFLLVKTKTCKSTDSKLLSAIVVNVVTPCTILNSFMTEYEEEKAAGLLMCAIAALGFQLLLIVIFTLLKKPLNLNKVETAALIYSNGGNMVIPLVQALLGQEAVFYCSAFVGLQNFLIWTHCYALMSGQGFNLKSALKNKNLYSIIVGIIIFLCRIPMPAIVKNVTSSVAGILTPLSMFILGFVMAGVDLKKVLSRGRFYLVCAGRLIFCPSLAILLIKLTGVTSRIPYAKEVLMISFLAFSAPVAVMVVSMANMFADRKDAEDASSVNIMSVIFSLVTMPVMLYFYQILV